MPRGRGRAASPAPTARGRTGRRGSSAGAGSERRLAEIVERYVADLVDAVRQEVRRSVAAEVSGILGSSALVAGRVRRAGLVKKRVVGCIAPGCSNPSKGPRFHYLCDKHRDAKKQDYEAWRKARKEKQAA
jgi:hypothetical protein